METIRIDFGGTHNDNQKRKANELEEKINNVFDKYRLSDRDFFEYIKRNVDGYYMSTANFQREAEERDNGDQIIKNIFFRAKIDSQFNQILKGNSFILIGDVVICPRNAHSYFRVNDFYLCDDIRNPYEYEINIDCRSNLRTKYQEFDLSQINTVLNFSLIEDLPPIVSKIKFSRFIKKWERYLNFEYELTKMGISYIDIKKYRFLRACEVNASEENKEKFKDDIIFEQNKLIYIQSSSLELLGNEVKYVFVEIILTHRKENKSFLNQSLSLVGKRNKKILDAIASGDGKADLDYNQITLGECAYKDINEKTKEDKAYFFLPEAIDEDGNFDLETFENEYKEILDDNPILASTATGDIALYRRGKNAIDNLKEGRVKNPFLAGLLIEPDKFESSVNETKKIEFALKNLNESQMDAITKCLKSNSIFLIQGPPGTGKTQTITELVYQFNKMGKKVIVSSQTNIAIDNVIERLPKEMNVLPIRLVKDTKRVNKQYLPDKLLDNLYEAAYHKYNNKIETHKNYSEDIRKTKFQFEQAMSLYDEIENRNKEICQIDEKISSYRETLHVENEKLLDFKAKQNTCNRNQLFLSEYEKNHLNIDTISDSVYNEVYFNKLKDFCQRNLSIEEEHFSDLLFSLRRRIGSERKQKLQNLIDYGNTEESADLSNLNKEIDEVNIAIKQLESLNITEGKQHLLDKINELLQQKKKLESTIVKTIDLSKIKLFFSKNTMNSTDAIKEEMKILQKFRDDYANMVKTIMTTTFIEELKKPVDFDEEAFEKSIKKLEVQLNALKQEKEKMYEPIKSQKEKLDKYFNYFYTEKLNNNSLPEKDEDKLSRIKEYIDEQEKIFRVRENEFNIYKEIYEDTVNLLKDRKEYLPQQRHKFTKTLFHNNANVYGITCTSSPTFKTDRNEYLKQLEIGDVNVARQDFDVIIIDEVSKATPIEIMIPLLYGKTVVLVGDQRQLPPIFKYRDSMFEELSEEQRKKLFKGTTLEEFKNQVESSLFEEIFNLLSNNKAMLNEQYRFNTQIMNCVNVFYDDNLKAGFGSLQDNKKQHYLRVDYKCDNRTFQIFDPKWMTYWFNSNKYADDVKSLEKAKDGKTSLYNDLEAKITIQLLKLLEKGYENLAKAEPEKYIMSAGDSRDDVPAKPTIAVITMYGAQISYIKNLIKNDAECEFKYIDYDISTVDNYQGKEKDIIIVNFVRNNKKGETGEFIKKFNRINVAISRARNMLLIVGSKEFCSNLNVDVPKMGSNKKNIIHAYGKICERCNQHFNHPAGIFDIKYEKGDK